MNPIDTHLIKDTRKRTAKRNELHPMTKLSILAGSIALLAILAGGVALLAVLYYMSVATDAIIGLMLI